MCYVNGVRVQSGSITFSGPICGYVESQLVALYSSEGSDEVSVVFLEYNHVIVHPLVCVFYDPVLSIVSG